MKGIIKSLAGTEPQADTYICLATGLVGDMIPESVRQEVEGKSN